MTYSHLKEIAALRLTSDMVRRETARNFARANNIIFYKSMGQLADSVALANCIEDAADGWNAYNAAKEANTALQGQLKEARRITVGGWIVRIGLVGLAAYGVVQIADDLKP